MPRQEAVVNYGYPPILFCADGAAEYLGISVHALKLLGLKRKIVTPKILRYYRPDLDAVTQSQIKSARRAAGELSPKRMKDVPDIVRAFVYDRDGMVCRYCGDTEGPHQIDHVLPVSRGGDHGPDNLAVACRSCNCSKGSKTLAEWKPTPTGAST